MTDELLDVARREAALGSTRPDLIDRLCDEVDRLRAVLELIAIDGCGLGGPDPDNPVGPWTTCRTHGPEDKAEWCWSCILADALEADRG